MIVTLTWAEAWVAAELGGRRHLAALQRSLPDRHGFTGDPWGIHIEGAAGEMAVAKALGMFWCGSINTFRSQADLGTRIEIRTRSRSDYDLLIRPDDADDAAYVLVTGRIPRFEVVGWCFGHEAKQAEFERTYGDRPAAYFVPKSHLAPMDTLRAQVLA